MSESKIQVKVGMVEFSGEGNQDWLAKQLDKILEKVPELLKIEIAAPEQKLSANKSTSPTSENAPKNLAVFLKDKNATVNQTRKFLATAVFWQLKGNDRSTTSDIAKILKDANQARLGNPSDCLAKNISKGHCEKDGSKNFFVTSEGYKELGINID
jgi:hypothetical protein